MRFKIKRRKFFQDRASFTTKPLALTFNAEFLHAASLLF